MDRKAYLLSSLKKQVLHLKTQLDQIQKHKVQDKSHTRSVTQASRFNTNSFDSTYLDKGVKKFPLKDNCHNISQIIQKKSTVQKAPKLSPFRKAEQQRTKQNFSEQKKICQSIKKTTPNPLTGQGYSQRKKGIKTAYFKRQPQSRQTRQTQRRHFSFYLY